MAMARARAFLDGVFGNAPALGRALAREPAQLRKVAEQGPGAAFASVLAEISDAAGLERPPWSRPTAAGRQTAGVAHRGARRHRRRLVAG